MAKLKWFCFDLALKLALYTCKKKKKKAKKQSQYSVCYLQGQVKRAGYFTPVLEACKAESEPKDGFDFNEILWSFLDQSRRWGQELRT